MPTYEYRCRECGEHLEVVQSFRDDPLTECPSCGGQLRKVFGAIGITFKGSGFYKTDSRAPVGAGKGKGDAAGGDKADKGGKGEKGEKAAPGSSSESSSAASGTAGSSGDGGGGGGGKADAKAAKAASSA